MQLSVVDLKVRSLDLDFHELSWRVEDTTIDVLDFTFQVLRSESPSVPFDASSVPFEDRYVFIDNVLQVAHRWRTYFYLLRVTHKPTGTLVDVGPVSKAPDADLLAKEIRRLMQFLFREFAGRRCW